MGRLVTLSVVVFVTGCGVRAGVPRSVERLRQAPIYTFTERELDAYLRHLATQPLSMQGRVRLIARQSIGQPYELGVLGEFPFEVIDPDPMVCLAASDCVTFVEQTYAMAKANDWESFIKYLVQIRYQNSIIGFETRNHFVETDWNWNNTWLFDEVSRSISDGNTTDMLTQVDYTAFFAKHKVRRDMPVNRYKGIYIPREHISKTAPQIRDGDVVQLVKGDEQLQYVSHMGLLFHDEAGRVTMLHSGKPAVREVVLESYLQSHPTVLGIKVLRPR
ncbi:MAG: N-acetylmuramoyl-L-alanine amidase-like domain-containing protein [Planctomycetota bacterium]